MPALPREPDIRVVEVNRGAAASVWMRPAASYPNGQFEFLDRCHRLRSANLDAAHSWHIAVEQDDVETLLADFFKRGFTTSYIVDDITLPDERRPHDATKLWFVIND